MGGRGAAFESLEAEHPSPADSLLLTLGVLLCYTASVFQIGRNT